MTTYVAPVPPPARPGDTVMVNGRAALTLHLLPRLAGRPPAARVTHDPPCRLCEAALRWELAARRWRCSECADAPAAEVLAAWAREHTADGVRAGRTRRRGVSRQRQIARGAPGAAAVLRRAAADGGALSRAALLAGVAGAERRALQWALRDAGDAPLNPERCRAAAAALETTV